LSRTVTLILAVLLIGVLCVAIFVGAPVAPPPALPTAFLTFARADVKSVDLKNIEGEIHLERDAADSSRWRLRVEGVLVRADSAKVEELLNDLSRLAPKQYWKKSAVRPGERAGWGLDKPRMAFTLGLPSGPVRAVFGNRTAMDKNYFTATEDEGDVYVVPVGNLDPFETTKAVSFRERKPLGFSSYEAKTIALARADGTVLDMAKSAGHVWEVTAPFKGAADPTTAGPFVAKILDLDVVDFAADGSPDLEKYGLAKPRATLGVKREGREKPVVLRFGKDAGEGRAYFMEEGEPSVLVCGADALKAIEGLDPAGLRDRNLLRIGYAKLDTVEFAHPDHGWKLLRVLDRWDVEKPERTPADAVAVEALLEEIRKVEVAKFLDGEDPAKLGLMPEDRAPCRLVLAGADEASGRTLLLGNRDGDRVPALLLPPKDSKDAPVPVFLDAKFLEILSRGWLAWRGREVLKFDNADVRSIARRTAAGEETFLREGGLWKAAPGGKEPDHAALSAALVHLLTLHCAGFEAKTKEGLEQWGLADPPAGPSITVTLRKEGEKEERTKTLVFGAPVPGKQEHYARVADGDLVFRLPDQIVNGTDIVKFWEIESGDWAKK
jgi:hypothetical protein